MKYQIVSSYPEVSGEEYDIANKMLNWINESKIYNTDLDVGTDIEFVPTIPDDSAGTFLTPKEELPKSKPISIPKKDIRGESKITYTRRELNPQEFVSDFTNRYIQRGVNPEVAKIIAVQNLLESRSRDTRYYSQLADQYHNYGGVKWVGSLSDPSKYVTFDSEEEEDGVRNAKSSEFRVFKDRDDYVNYVIDLLKRRYDLRLDRSYTADEYLSSLMGNNKSGYAWATASNYSDTIRSMAKSFKSGGILKAQHGVLLNTYSDPNHPTNKIGQYYDKKEGLKRFYNKYNDRYYTLEEWSPSRFMPGMEEVGYDLKPNPFDDRIGRYMKGHTKEDEYDR